MNGAQHDNQQVGYQQPPPGRETGPQEAFGGTGSRTTTGGAHKSPALATWLSLGPGLGQIYVGYYNQGFINIAVVAGIITVLASSHIGFIKPFLGVFLAFYWIYNMIDANRRAHHYNKSMSGLGGETVPEDFKLPRTGGSLTWGIVLMALGVLFILDLNFDVSLDWIEDWWPLVLVIFGARLIFNARQTSD